MRISIATLSIAFLLSLAACAFRGPKSTAPEAPSVTGAWQVHGEDGVPWSARLQLEEDGQNGTFDWRSEAGHGRERVRWSFDPTSRTVQLEGIALEEASGSICLGTYEARLSSDGSRMIGTWGAPAAPGTWFAIR